MSQNVRTETDLKQTRTGQIWNTRRVCHCSITSHGFTAQYSTQRNEYAQVGTARSLQRCSYSNYNKVEEKEKKTFWTQHGTNEERQNWEEENVLSNRCVLDAMCRHFVPRINSTNDIGRLPECCVKEFPFRSFVIVSSDNAPSVLRKENRGRHRR